MSVHAPAFTLPAELEADRPPEARGLARDHVRLLVATGDGSLVHARFHELPALLEPGDLVVVNLSATLPAAFDGRRADGFSVRVHFSTRVPGLGADWRVVELRSRDGSVPATGEAGERITLADGAATLSLAVPYLESAERLWVAHVRSPVAVQELMAHHGMPIRYGHTRRSWPLADYQNVYATEPGSAEMPSAGRPFSAPLLAALVARGVAVAPVTLHTGVSSPEAHEPPYPEPYDVPEATARRVNETRAAGGRVVAVGTTVVRALESAADAEGRVHADGGWTELVIDAARGVRAVDGIITGWHEPEASHLAMLEAIGGADVLERSYAEALRRGYLWHEFGDSHLILSGDR